MNQYLAHYLRQKQAAVEHPVLEGLLSTPANMLLNAGTMGLGGPLLAQAAGTGLGSVEYAGALSSQRKNKERAGKSLAWSLLPGVANYERGSRVRQTARAANATGGHGTANALSEYLGVVPSSLLAGAIGAGVGAGAGAVFGADDVGSSIVRAGAAVGAGAAMLIPMAAASLLAAINKKRTKTEQLEHDSSGGNAAMNYMIPGAAMYNYFKRQGAAENFG